MVPSAATSGNVVVLAAGVPSNGVNLTVIPVVSVLSPSSGAIGSNVLVFGTGFGASQGTGGVTFNGTAATVSSWHTQHGIRNGASERYHWGCSAHHVGGSRRDHQSDIHCGSSAYHR
jgi:hypothetical protein